jgi:1-acyl-sn-glycerol-3-phosphate acyltransferase
VRTEEESVVHGTPVRPSVARLARLAGVPIVPVVVWGTPAYWRGANWLPLRRTRYGVIYGEPFEVTDEAEGERQLVEAFKRLYVELREEMITAPQDCSEAPPPRSTVERELGSHRVVR